ncbi:MAG: 3D domain-containing protein [Acidobacteriota bacterium]
MKNLVRGGAILSLIGMFVVLIYAQNQTNIALNIAENSQTHLESKIDGSNLVTDDKKKLVKKTVSERRVEPRSAAVAAGSNRGSFTATAYCLKGRTALGHGVRRGIIAADPRILRLGSRVSLGAGNYSGQYLVSDTGGGVNGREIDIWVPSCAEARRFGRRTVTVAMLAQ